MKKIIYYMQVDWGWIEQRPHILARGLAEQAEVHVVYMWEYKRASLQKNAAGKIKLHPILHLPHRRFRYPWLNRLNHTLGRWTLNRMIRRISPDIVWLTHPCQWAELPPHYKGIVVYDCMDDHGLLWPQPNQQKALSLAEQALCQRASVIFASSNSLAEKLRGYGQPEKVRLVRNGCSGEIFPRYASSNGPHLRAGYVGTIAHWFDFDLLLKSLKRFPDLEYELIGPVSLENVPSHPRLHYRGTVAHADLYRAVREMDVLVMPFKRLEGIDAVDPVKLYEYISWQKPILAVWYPEVERFSSFAALYKDQEEYLDRLQAVRQAPGPRYSEEKAKEFLQNNSWNARMQNIRQAIEELSETE